MADSTQMQIVMSSILSNASESIEGKGYIKISCRNELIAEDIDGIIPYVEPGNYIRISFEDNGKGMDEETRNRVFEPFFSTKFYGRGLAMAAVYGIIKNHSGYIHIESEPGKGTSVHIYLPRTEKQKEEVESPEREFSKGTGTILIIEDEDMVMDVSCKLIGEIFTTAIDPKTGFIKAGREAVDTANSYKGKIDIALLDFLLPDIDGKALYPILKKTRPDMKVIICSGYSAEGPVQDILDAGAEGFIQKPFSMTSLSRKIKEVIG